MNKQIISMTAVAAMAGAALAVESKNVVGYTTQTSGEGFDFIAAPFSAVGYTTTDIQQIKISDGGAGTIGWGGEILEIWQGGPDVVDGYFYYDATMDPNGEATDYYWGDDVGEKVTFSIAEGQGLALTAGADLDVSVSGQVPAATAATMTTGEGFDFIGNPFPTAIDIQAIAISDGGAGTIGWGGEILEVWQGGPDVVDGYFYYDATMDPNGEATDYYWGDDVGEKVTFSIPAGQGLVLTAAADLDVSITPPYNQL